jgi:hypothetical protein
MPLETFGREEFLKERWHYQTGQHVTILGPTGSGKTHLMWQLLEHTANPQVPAVILAMKPRDTTTESWMKKLKYKKVGTWPPIHKLFTEKPAGYVVWPPHSFDAEQDDWNHEVIFRGVFNDCYRRGDRILVCDEILATKDLNLNREMVRGWTRGRSMGMGLWGGSQRPFDVPLYAYGQAEHLFIANDPDHRSRKRYSEIGGFDGSVVASWVHALKKHQFLYIGREGPVVCVVDKCVSND